MEDSIVRLEQAYRRIKNAHSQIDSLDVVREVADYRNFWRPTGRINVVLLAESHVYTSDVDFKIEFDYANFRRLTSIGYPKKFVRFVYCIGYSESKLFASRPLDPNFKNPGTWQYWKLFCACASAKPNVDCSPLLKGSNKDFVDRINKKIDLLDNMKGKGIWLVDSSIVGINNLPEVGKRKEIITLSWENYVRCLIEEAKPRFVICIGKTVWDATWKGIEEMGIRYDYIHQPQAHLTSAQRVQEIQKLREICSTYCALSA